MLWPWCDSTVDCRHVQEGEGVGPPVGAVGGGETALAYPVHRLDLDLAPRRKLPLDRPELRGEDLRRRGTCFLRPPSNCFPRAPEPPRSRLSTNRSLSIGAVPPFRPATGSPSSRSRSRTPPPTPSSPTTASGKSFILSTPVLDAPVAPPDHVAVCHHGVGSPLLWVIGATQRQDDRELGNIEVAGVARRKAPPSEQPLWPGRSAETKLRAGAASRPTARSPARACFATDIASQLGRRVRYVGRSGPARC